MGTSLHSYCGSLISICSVFRDCMLEYKAYYLFMLLILDCIFFPPTIVGWFLNLFQLWGGGGGVRCFTSLSVSYLQRFHIKAVFPSCFFQQFTLFSENTGTLVWRFSNKSGLRTKGNHGPKITTTCYLCMFTQNMNRLKISFPNKNWNLDIWLAQLECGRQRFCQIAFQSPEIFPV